MGAVASFARDVNAAKDATNTRIANVQAGKYAQYAQYQAYLAYRAALAEAEAAWQAAQGAKAGLKRVLGPVDITQRLLATMFEAEYREIIAGRSDAEIALKQAFWLFSLAEFIGIVASGQMYDLKSRGWSVERDYLFMGEAIRGDAPGNILYGYLGTAYGFPEVVLLAGAGYAQIVDGNARPEFIGSYFDDPSDQYYIRKGIDLYNLYH
jgi:hypothetical protein